MRRFINAYPKSKVIRIGAVPQNQTLERMKEAKFLEKDEQRAEDYKKVKKIIDEYHKVFIEKVLKQCELPCEDKGEKNSLSEYFFLYQIGNKTEGEKLLFQEVQDRLRKLIVGCFIEKEEFKELFSKELIKTLLPLFVETDEDRLLVESFFNFTTYFKGFHENRKNIYSEEAISTSIAFRIIHQNLPKFIDNIFIFEEAARKIGDEALSEIYAEMKDHLEVNSLTELFQISYFSKVLNQSQIDVYNAVIGGKSVNEREKGKGLNEYINLYNQKQKEKKDRIPTLKPLFKQILSDRMSISFLPEEFESDQETLETIKEVYDGLQVEVFGRLKSLLSTVSDYNLQQIYLVNDSSLTEISQRHYGNWGIISKAISVYYEGQIPQKRKEDREQYEERIAKQVKLNASYSIGFINQCVSLLDENAAPLEKYFVQLGAIETNTSQRENLISQIENAYLEAETLFKTPYSKEKNLAQAKHDVHRVKTLLDALKDLQRYIKPLLGSGEESNKDEKFYGDLLFLWEELEKVTPLYNKVRNRMTRKPYSTEKFKVNFNNSTLLDGWDVNKESDNASVILRKNGLYYLGIMNSEHNKVFKKYKANPTSGDYYQKMEYKLLPGANKMLPKVFFSQKRIKDFNPSASILRIRENETFKKGANFSLDDCHELIDFFKSSINKHEDWKSFDFQFSDTKSYDDISGFYREVEHQGYKISYRNIDTEYINQLVEEGKLYLFQLYNKDFSPHSKGTPNMHTLYWKMLFDPENLKNVVYKLNGQAEMFFRKASIKSEDRVIHYANQPISKKRKDSKEVSLFTHDLIKDKRYTVDQFELHVPITMNFKAQGVSNLNESVREYLRENNCTHVIGIDRGERNLLYVTVINPSGDIVKQFSLNQIINQSKNGSFSVDYNQLLQSRQEGMEEARKGWKTIESIKELKEGYLSQAIHVITQLMIEYKAIVVLEDLNFGFMRGRQKVEKQIYQKFERMLIEKLNYLVDKRLSPNEPGGLLNAYQLTNEFVSFQKLGKQSGFLFYVPAWNTSKIDPVTGFVNLFDTHYENMGKTKLFFSKFDSIRYNPSKDWFEFSFDYNKFTHKAEGTQTRWTLTTQGTRIKTYRSAEDVMHWVSKSVNLTELFKSLFKSYDIDIHGNLKEAIAVQEKKDFFYNEDKELYSNGLLQLFKLMVQMRNSETEKDTDYLISPVADVNGCFYNSETCGEALPRNADANGAYNIARKGLWVINQIKQAKDIRKVQLAISNKDWLKYAQGIEE